MKNRRNYYRILQVQPDAPREIIRASYRALMRDLKKHPDLGGSTADASLLNEAYEILTDPTRRAAYDEKMHARYFRRTADQSESREFRLSKSRCPFCKTRLEQSERGQDCPACRIPLPSSERSDLNKTGGRAIIRVKKNGRIHYLSAPAEAPKEAQLVDISPKGMRFKCAGKLRLGAVLKITGPGLTACGIVTNLHDEEAERSGLYAVGISFLAIRFEDIRGSFISLSG
jgi:curved DNA-binding protein CbpA